MAVDPKLLAEAQANAAAAKAAADDARAAMTEAKPDSVIKKEAESATVANDVMGGDFDLTQGCPIDPVKPTTSNVSKNFKVDDVSADLDDVNKELQLILAQLKILEDCDLIQELIRPYIKKYTDQLDSAVKEQLELAEQYLPLIKLPTTPWGVVSWVKKLSAGNILPKIKAYIKLALEIIELVNTVKKILAVVKDLDKKLIACAKETGENTLNNVADIIAKNIEQEILDISNNVLGPVFCELKRVESQLDAALGTSTIPLDFSSAGAFVNSVPSAIADKEARTKNTLETPIEERQGYTGSVTNPDGSISEYKDGMLVNVIPAPQPA